MDKAAMDKAVEEFNAEPETAEKPEEQEVSEPEQEAEEKDQPEKEKDESAAKEETDEAETYFKRMKEGQTIPYKRFKQFIDKKNELKKKYDEYESKMKGYTDTESKYNALVQNLQMMDGKLSKHPWLEKALTKLLNATEDGQLDFSDVYEALGEMISKAQEQGQAPQMDVKTIEMERRLAQLEAENKRAAEERNIQTLQARYLKEKERAKKELPKLFKNVDIDDAFFDEVFEMMEGKLAKVGDDPKEVAKVSYFETAKKIAERRKAIMEKVLSAQAAKRPLKEGAALEKSTGKSETDEPDVKIPTAGPARFKFFAEQGEQLMKS